MIKTSTLLSEAEMSRRHDGRCPMRRTRPLKIPGLGRNRGEDVFELDVGECVSEYDYKIGGIVVLLYQRSS